MTCLETVKPRFAELVIPLCSRERLHTGMRWAEGPCDVASGRSPLFSDIPSNRVLRWEEGSGVVSPFRFPSNLSNGNTRDRQGGLVTCEHGTRRIAGAERGLARSSCPSNSPEPKTTGSDHRKTRGHRGRRAG